MNYYIVPYTLYGFIENKEKKKKNDLPLPYKHVGFFYLYKDAVMVAEAMTQPECVIRDFIFHSKGTRWCLFNQNELDNLLAELIF